MTAQKIFVSLDHNELARPRAAKVEKAVLEDDRFEMRDPADLPFDLQFTSRETCPVCRGEPIPDLEDDDEGLIPVICGHCIGHGYREKSLHVELKDFSEDGNSDYLGSILNGHLWAQVLVAREMREPLIIVILGDDNDVGAAIRKASGHGNRGHRFDPEKLMEYFRMVEGFEANCIALNIQVWRLKTDPYKRMLLRVRKMLEGGDLSGFAPAPANGERQAVGLSILAGRGVGPKKAASVLEKFDVCLRPKVGHTGGLAGCKGIGPKLEGKIKESIEVLE